jgi:hypothetical protein
MTGVQTVAAVASRFEFPGEFLSAIPHGNGHINDTWRVVFHYAGVPVRFILQRINRNIFTNPVALMENVERVTAHLAAQVDDEPDCSRRVLTLIPARDGRAWLVDEDGDYWRAWRFIERARAYDAVESVEQAYQAAKAFRPISEDAHRHARTAIARYYF